ncbi:HAD family hydrolase [Streptomyces sp. NRAIS3]
MEPVIAVVFDCDGVLLDTGPVWGQAERRVIEGRGGRWTPEFRRQANGLSIPDVAGLLARTLRAPTDVQLLHNELVSAFDDLLQPELIQPMAGVRSLLALLDGQVPLGVASNCPLPLLERLMNTSGLAPYFGAVVGLAGDLPPKPCPDVYLQACQELGARPSQCLAFEDSQTGVDAALAAGLHVTGIAPPGVLRGCPSVGHLEDVTGLVGAHGLSDFHDAVTARDGAGIR